VLDVEGEDLARPAGGLVEHAPQRPLAQRHVAARELALDRSLGEILRGVDVLSAPFDSEEGLKIVLRTWARSKGDRLVLPAEAAGP